MQRLRLFEDFMTTQEQTIRQIVEIMRRAGVRYAMIGGHAVSVHARPRVTVDVDFLFSGKGDAQLQALFEAEGFHVERHGEVMRLWASSPPAEGDEPLADFIRAELNRTQIEALRTAVEVDYRGVSVCVVSKPALVALKFLSATSAKRDH